MIAPLAVSSLEQTRIDDAVVWLISSAYLPFEELHVPTWAHIRMFAWRGKPSNCYPPEGCAIFAKCLMGCVASTATFEQSFSTCKWVLSRLWGGLSLGQKKGAGRLLRAGLAISTVKQLVTSIWRLVCNNIASCNALPSLGYWAVAVGRKFVLR